MIMRCILSILSIIIFMGNIVYAKQLPLSHLSSRKIAIMLNSPETQRQGGAIVGNLSSFALLEKSENRVYYSAYVPDGINNNGRFIFEEDLDGNLYVITFYFNKNDKKMLSNCAGVLTYYLDKIGAIPYALYMDKKGAYIDSETKIMQVQVPSLNGYLIQINALNKEDRNIMTVVTYLSSTPAY